ncbi:prephenate dehydrogenase/arogenate dehydrogenase family protein [Candidatus Micrarchaeota archaeon]|nr:prephenate dehydrogenase/arogenate dehydrogenase family protein [Candidatus Micrarchaeota archaeon]MBU1166304.1 prephenate dehydrogenase/arogenate dehydrogenase family protein [Candidatus Micrarchaeota archaeon]MBU1886386.1 prephenate dehydrogenase/arogenate dehydrogenase family protein [Candidatus Micrarchaeota archaeon]
MKIVIIGIGKMGSWLAKELVKDHEVVVYDRNQDRASAIKDAKAISDLSDISEFAPEMMINAVSLQSTANAFDEVMSYLPKDCIICDVASVKGELPTYYKKYGKRFVSIHPMFGPTHANMENLKQESLVIIRESDQKATQFFREFFGKLGLTVFGYTFAEHDQIMAYSLTTPFAASLVFAACVDKSAIPGTNFARHMELSKGLLAEDDHLLAEILFNPYSIRQIESINNRLELLKHIIKGRDYEEAKKFFDKLRENVGE